MYPKSPKTLCYKVPYLSLHLPRYNIYSFQVIYLAYRFSATGVINVFTKADVFFAFSKVVVGVAGVALVSEGSFLSLLLGFLRCFMVVLFYIVYHIELELDYSLHRHHNCTANNAKHLYCLLLLTSYKDRRKIHLYYKLGVALLCTQVYGLSSRMVLLVCVLLADMVEVVKVTAQSFVGID